MILKKTSSFELLIVTVVCVFLFFYGAGSFGLVGADEPRYAQIAREMLARHDFVSPTINGEPWLEKPALYYWLGMAVFKVFGVTDAAARFPSALLALVMVFAVFFFARRFRPGSQLDAAIVAASSAAIFAFSRGASTDMPLTASFTIAMLAWYSWHERQEKKWLLVFYLFLALATLAKGPVAPLLAGLIVLVFCALHREIDAALRTLSLPGVTLYFAVTLPWFVAVQIRNPQFLHVFILEHNLERFGSNMFHHRQPFWYYIPVFILAMAPWSLFAIPALTNAVRHALYKWRRANGGELGTDADGLRDFLCLWTLLPILFFSLSQSKLPGYILPSVPPCAMLIADWLRRRDGEVPLREFIMAGHAFLLGTLIAFVIVFPAEFIRHLPMPMAGRYLAASAALITAVGVYLALRRGGREVLRAATLVPVILVVGFILKVAAPDIDNYYSARPVARQIGRMYGQKTQVAVFDARRELRYGLNFYRNQPIPSYNDGEIPTSAHLLIAKAGSLPRLSFLLRGRQLLLLGGFPEQNLQYFAVSAAGSLNRQGQLPPSDRSKVPAP
jgi:4-amino-4-deoxy-L-arabinose transferase-like glycosyltransferase